MGQIFGTRMVTQYMILSAKSSTYKPLVLATQAIANVVKSSFGPSGLDKMMVDDIGVRMGKIILGCQMLTIPGCYRHK